MCITDVGPSSGSALASGDNAVSNLPSCWTLVDIQPVIHVSRTASREVGLRVSSSLEIGCSSDASFFRSTASVPSCASSSNSVLALPLDSTGDGSVILPYGDMGGCRESEGLEFLQACGTPSAFRAHIRLQGITRAISPVGKSRREMGAVGRWGTGRVRVRGEMGHEGWTGG